MAESPLTLEALIRVILAIAVIVLLFPACSKIRDAIYNPDSKYISSFNNFVEDINDMGLNRKESFSVMLSKDSAIIGLSKEGKGFEYQKAEGTLESLQSKFEKPSVSQCTGSACICLCSGISYNPVSRGISCKELKCKELNQQEASSDNILFFNPFIGAGNGKYDYWKNGFLFGRNLGYAYNGIQEKNTESNTFLAEKKKVGEKTIVNICSQDIYLNAGENKRNNYFGDKCIITEFDEAQKFESIIQAKKIPEDCTFCSIKEDLLQEKAIKKYTEFVGKYSSGPEVEESLYRLAALYAAKKNNEKAIEYLNKLLKDYPETKFREEARKMLNSLTSPESSNQATTLK